MWNTIGRILRRGEMFDLQVQKLMNVMVMHRKFSMSTWFNAVPKKHKLPPRPKWLIVEEELEEKFIKGGSGPGGQKINKTNSKVQLVHKPTGIVVSCQYSRSRENNRKKAREILALKLENLQNPQGSRTKVLEERMNALKKNKKKKSARKYRKIEDDKRKQGMELESELESELKSKGEHGEVETIIDPEAELDRIMAAYGKKTE